MRIRQPKIVDLRAELVVHKTRRFARRKLGDIRGVVFHQELADFTVRGVAKYHVSKESHISPGVGCPAICYTFFVDPDGTIFQCNDLENVTWSQGGGAAPLPMTRSNTNYLAVCFRGEFAGKGHKAKGKPTDAQLESARALWVWLRHHLSLPEDMLFGHHDFGKPACPGTVLSKLIDDICKEGLDVKGNLPRTIKDWQGGLVRLGYDLGPYGPKKDGVDGSWGGDSQAALVKFQTSECLATGEKDAPTATTLATRLAALPVPKKSKSTAAPKTVSDKSK